MIFKKNMQKNNKLFGKFLLSLLAVIVVILSTFFYCKNWLNKWLLAHELEVHISSLKPTLTQNNGIALGIKDIEVKNLNSHSTLKKAVIKKLTISPFFKTSLKSLFQNYGFLFEIEALNFNDKHQMYVAIEKASGQISHKNNMYHFQNISIEPLHFGLIPQYSTLLENGNEQEKIVHLLIHKINIDGYYSSNSGTINLCLNIPNQQIDHAEKMKKYYSLDAKGSIFLKKLNQEKNRKEPAMTHQSFSPNGNIEFKIDHFSNLLEDLNQARVISTLAKNLGSVIGYPVTKKKLSDKEIEEIMTNAVTLKLTLTPEAAYIGSLKVYP